MIEFIHKEGVLALQKGVFSTIFRDIPQYATFFMTFEYAKQWMSSDGDMLSVFE
jgi:solute carrier family 25 carnitine/acylcarnitine transporter 20/29